MRGEKRRLLWLLTWLTLVLTAPAWAQMAPVGGQEQPLSAARQQVTQTLTIAICGDVCNCGAATRVAKQNAPCSVQSTTGSCSIGSGECCVCAADNTVAVCGDTCNCGAALLLTKVSAPCTATSSAGQCSIGSGSCCVCVPQ
jgi:hypothetical protein